MSYRLKIGIIVCAAIWAMAYGLQAAPMTTITGVVVDDHGCPVPGASVILARDGVAITGQATDANGKFALNYPAESGKITVQISAVGFVDRSFTVMSGQNTDLSDISLQANPPDVGVIKVMSGPQLSSATVTNAAALREHARRNLIPSDPISSLDGPSTARLGSSHSAQVRVDGTNPQYYLNGMAIGTDPSHYGAFAVIPLPVISEMRFFAQGTPADFGSPSAVEFTTADNFSHHSDGEVQLSTIDLTTRFSAGSPNFSMLGSVRKSVLDEIVTKIQVNSKRRTIPPTAFLDMYLSTGWKLSNVYSLAIDQYHVRDKLSFNTSGATGSPDGVDTYQRTDGSHIGLRLRALYPWVLLRGTIGFQTSRKEYSATPQPYDTEEFRLGLREDLQAVDFSASAAFVVAKTSFEIGTQGNDQSSRRIHLTQQNWNFLPPFANSNNGYIYQIALNRDWNNYDGSSPSFQQAAYIAAERRFGRFTLEGGVRGEYFRSLADRTAIVGRQSLIFQPGAGESITLYHGTFAESPVDNILEPYQVIINAQQAQLLPIKTDLWSLEFARHGLQLSVYQKRITNRPVITPDFSQVDLHTETVGPAFLEMQSTGAATFTGGTVSLDLQKFPGRSFDTHLWYGYTQAEKVENGVSMPYELNAPHRFGSAIDLHLTKRWSLGGELQVRSGYPYTPVPASRLMSFEGYYSPAYYYGSLKEENSQRFPLNAFLNFHAGYTYRGGAVFFSISNITNRANPIVNSSSGYIYDAGILPMVGLELHF